MGAKKSAKEANKSAKQPGELICVDETIDGIAQAALALARKREELERLQRKAGSVSPTSPPVRKP